MVVTLDTSAFIAIERALETDLLIGPEDESHFRRVRDLELVLIET